MENASNALIMAAEILIAILVLTLIVTVNVIFGSFSRSVNDQIALSRDAKFNTHFYNYLNRADISSSEVASIINFSKITNDENGYKRIDPNNNDANKSSPYYINVYINNVSFFYGFKNPDNSAAYVDSDHKYDNRAEFKDAVNDFISDYKQFVFCCNVIKLNIPNSVDEIDSEHKPVVVMSVNGDDHCAVSVTDPNHPNVKQDGSIRVVRIDFKTIDTIPVNVGAERYDITTANNFSYIIQ